MSVDVLNQTADFARTHGEVGVLKIKPEGIVCWLKQFYFDGYEI